MSNSPLSDNFTSLCTTIMFVCYMAYGTHAQCMTQIRTHTFNSLTCICLQPAFEGTFKLRMSIFPALISPDIDAVDPTGHGRRRIVNVKMVYGDATWVFW